MENNKIEKFLTAYSNWREIIILAIKRLTKITKNRKMVHMKNKNTLLKKLIFIAILIYAIITFIKQQKILNTYGAQAESIESQIAEAKEYQEQLNQEKENVNSSEYIEAIAREKLDMYLPNERVYVDNEN